jgi:autotransporter-associated beta strand protein
MTYANQRGLRKAALLPLSFILLGLLAPAGARAATIVKANNSSNLNIAASWLGGLVPGTNDVALWDSNAPGQTVSLGGDLSWLGVLADATHAGSVTINSGNTLTIGAAGIYSWPNITFTLNNAISLDVDQTWGRGGSGTSIYGGPLNMNGRTLTLTGGGTHQFKTSLTNGGVLVVSHSSTKFSNGTTATNTDVVIPSPGILYFDTAGAIPPRMKSVTMRGGILAQTANANTMNDLIGVLTFEKGDNDVLAGATATRTTQIEASSLVRTPGSAILFRGSNLGVFGLNPLVTNCANIKIAQTPDMAGAGGAAGTTSNSILVGAIGDTVSSGNGYGVTSGGLVTYDTNFGVRLLNAASEYVPSLTGGLAGLDNIRLANNTATQAVYTVDADSTVNSLSFLVSGPTNSAIKIEGAGRLTLNSGVIYANQTISTSTFEDRMSLSNAVLDLNGREGVILFNTANAQSSGIGGGLLEISSKIVNDGGNGITFAGENGTAKLVGKETNDYTGITRLLSGKLWLAKAKGVSAVPGHLLVMGGTVIGWSNQMPDEGDITIRGGGYTQAASLNTGSGANEKFRDLYMFAGTYNSGAHGTSSGLTTNRNVFLAGGTWNLTKGHQATTTGNLTLSGGTNLLSGSSDSSAGARQTLSGSLSITNAPAGVYTPLLINNATGSAPPAQLTLSGDLDFTGHPGNTNAALISQGTGGLPGRLILGGTRTFSIADGPASLDLVISACITNSGVTNSGLIKAGSGTLALAAATNYFTGPTSVSNGTLAIVGRVISPVTVSSGAILAGTGPLLPTNSMALAVEAGGTVDPGPVNEVGTLAVTGNFTFAAGAILRVNADGGTADLLAVSGSAAAPEGPALVSLDGPATGSLLVLTASAGITGSFTTDAPGYKAVNRGTELWLEPAARGTLILVN